MDRGIIENIIKSLDTGTMLKALSAVGVQIDPQTIGGEGEGVLDQLGGNEDQLESWNDMQIDVAPTQRGPISDPSKYMGRGVMPQARRPMGLNQQNPDMEPGQMGGMNGQASIA